MDLYWTKDELGALALLGWLPCAWTAPKAEPARAIREPHVRFAEETARPAFREVIEILQRGRECPRPV